MIYVIGVLLALILLAIEPEAIGCLVLVGAIAACIAFPWLLFFLAIAAFFGILAAVD